MTDKTIVYLVRGVVTEPDAYGDGVVVGQPEYQFSDAPPPLRTYSADYTNLTEGLLDHADCIVIPWGIIE